MGARPTAKVCRWHDELRPNQGAGSRMTLLELEADAFAIQLTVGFQGADRAKTPPTGLERSVARDESFQILTKVWIVVQRHAVVGPVA